MLSGWMSCLFMFIFSSNLGQTRDVEKPKVHERKRLGRSMQKD